MAIDKFNISITCGGEVNPRRLSVNKLKYQKSKVGTGAKGQNIDINEKQKVHKINHKQKINKKRFR